jgi:1-deoxy-D-xylulose-5-phosphate synthase
MHDVCLQKLPVIFCLDRAGLVGSDGPTHHGIFDIAMLRPLPELIIMQPADEAELAAMMTIALAYDGPSVIRYPRDPSPGKALPNAPEPLPIGKAAIHEPIAPPSANKRPIWFWALGDMLPLASATAKMLCDQGLSAGVVNPRFIKPVDTALLVEQATDNAIFVTIENGIRQGGFGSAVQEALTDAGCNNTVIRFGWPDNFVEHGTTAGLMEKYGLTPENIAGAVQNVLKA